MFLLAPLIWSSSLPTITEIRLDEAKPTLEDVAGKMTIHPPRDANLSMIVVEVKPTDRGLASSAGPALSRKRTIEVIVSAP